MLISWKMRTYPPTARPAARYQSSREKSLFPGGPWNSTPLGRITSKRWKTSRYSSVISFSTWMSNGNSISPEGEAKEMKRTIIQTTHFMESNVLVNTEKISIRKGCNTTLSVSE